MFEKQKWVGDILTTGGSGGLVGAACECARARRWCGGAGGSAGGGGRRGGRLSARWARSATRSARSAARSGGGAGPLPPGARFSVGSRAAPLSCLLGGGLPSIGRPNGDRFSAWSNTKIFLILSEYITKLLKGKSYHRHILWEKTNIKKRQCTIGLWRRRSSWSGGGASTSPGAGGTRAACSRMAFFCSCPAAKYENTHNTA